MASEKLKEKDRMCKVCGELILSTAKTLKQHAERCGKGVK
jgi:ribosomal protein S27AE